MVALEITYLNKETTMWQNESGKAIYRTQDGRLVDEGDEAAAFLVVGPKGQISDADARQYGLVREAEAEPTAKAVEKPAENKARGKAEDK